MYRFILLFSLISLFFLSGCSVNYVQSGYLSEYTGIEPHGSLPSFWFDRSSFVSVNPSPKQVLCIETPESFPGLLDSGKDELERLLLDRLYWRGLLAFQGRVIIITHDDTAFYRKLGYEVWRLKTSLTEIRRGIGLLRYFIGLGAGAARCQIEGQLASSEQESLSFVVVVREAGKPYGFFNPRVFSSTYCLRIAVDRVAALISSMIANEISGVPISMKEQ